LVSLLVVIGVVIRSPGDLCDIKIARQTLIPAEPPQVLRFFNVSRGIREIGSTSIKNIVFVREFDWRTGLSKRGSTRRNGGGDE
jgi:hypothetical protein